MRRALVIVASTIAARKLVIAACALGMILLSAAPAQAGPECFGKRATKPVGSTTGTPGNDVLIGTDADETFDGLGGNDRICGRDGADTIEGGLGDDRLDGGPGNDRVYGDVATSDGPASGAGDDIVLGGPGHDHRLVGDSAALGVFAATGGGIDRVDGQGEGANFLVGDSFSEGSASGGGNDVIANNHHDGTIVGDSASLNFTAPIVTTATGAGDDTIRAGGGGLLVGDSFVEGAVGSSASGDGGDDTIFGVRRGDTITGDHAVGAGLSASGAGTDTIASGGGDDTVWGDNSAGGAPSGTSGARDVISAGSGDDTVSAGAGDDSMNGGRGFDTCDGGTDSGTGSRDRAEKCESTPNVP